MCKCLIEELIAEFYSEYGKEYKITNIGQSSITFCFAYIIYKSLKGETIVLDMGCVHLEN